ncbi:MAG: sugar phosphate isomerase/epimerase [Planctomycetes bacterium]|nr:sugar phosphate isomerase/epimerase [Planctomycetota bacterium]
MRQPQTWPVGICTWSLHDDYSVLETFADEGLRHLHVALLPIIEGDYDAALAIHKKDWRVTCTMINYISENYTTIDTIKETGGLVPDEAWENNKALTQEAIVLTQKLGVPYLSFHAGFIDHTNVEVYKKLLGRLQELADDAYKHGVMLLLETGQESARDLKACLQELNHPALGVNFDPANMILYDKGNPREALKILAPWIKHVHIKDAISPKQPGLWGEEVVWGSGEVGGENFLSALQEIGYEGALAIEREAGESRSEDIRTALQLLRSRRSFTPTTATF